MVQVVLIAESMRLQAMMATYGIQTQTPLEVEPVQIWPPSQLVQVYEFLGVNRKFMAQTRALSRISLNEFIFRKTWLERKTSSSYWSFRHLKTL